MLKQASIKYSRQIKEKYEADRMISKNNHDEAIEGPNSEDEWGYDRERALIFPKNITIGNFWLFLWVPSLVYEPNFLRRPTKRLADG
jgi:hypothetical protein